MDVFVIVISVTKWRSVIIITLIQTAFLITALAIVVHERVVNAKNVNSADQVAVEAKNKAVTIVEGPRLNKQLQPLQLAKLTKLNQTNSPELRPSSKPPILTPDKKFYYDNKPYHFYNSAQKLKAPPLHLYTKEPLKLSNSVYKFPNVIPMQRGNLFHPKPMLQQFNFAASTGNPLVVKSPKFSLPVQTINGIRTDFVRPPKIANLSTTTTTTTTAPSTTQRILRTKRIWPKRIIEKMNSSFSQNISFSSEKLIKNEITNSTDLATSASRVHTRYAATESPISSTTSQSTTRGYRRVTRTPRIKSTTPRPFDPIKPNDWVPIVPSHYTNAKKTSQTPITKRSDVFLQPYGLLPVGQSQQNVNARKKIYFFRKKQRQNPYVFNPEFNPKVVYPQPQLGYEDLQTDGTQSQPKIVTKIKHHHHHHHHRYIKTVEKPIKVPYKVEVEVPKPYPVEKKVPVPVPVEKIKVVDRPYPVQVEKKVPYPVPVKVPQPVPVKVIEKEYIPKPYPIVHHVPFVKHVEVKVPQPVAVPVEKRVPYPVQVPYPVEKKVPVPVKVETKVPYPVPVKVFVPQPYPVEKKVPYPVEVKVKEPVEIIRHVPVKVPYPQPYPVKIPHPIPYTVEKRVPYPVKVVKKVPYPVEVIVPKKVKVEKKVPVYIPKPYPVEKRVPYPVKVPYPIKVPVKVPVRVPVEVPVYIHHPFQIINDDAMGAGGDNNYYAVSESNYYADGEDTSYLNRSGAESVTDNPQHTVTVRGNIGYASFNSRSNNESTIANTSTK